jgi:hypothetical protein
VANTGTASVKDAIRRNRRQGNALATFFKRSRAYVFHCSLVPHRFIVSLIDVTRFLVNALGKNLSHVDCKVSPSSDRADRLALKSLRGERALTVASASNPHIPLKA